jgi:ABC-2 type transport system ATP-binding protein
MLCGLMNPSEGQAFVAGFDAAKGIDAMKDQIGYMAQRFGLYSDLTVEENMAFYADLFGLANSERDGLMAQLLQMTRMEPFRSRLAGKLSGGMKQKLTLMCTLLHHPRVLFLDEPTNGVDPVSRRDFWAILYQLVRNGLTVFITTAYLDEAERCNRVGLMYHGRLIRVDTPQNLRLSLAHSCYRVEAPDLRTARDRLAALPGVVSVEPSGSQLIAFVESPAEAIAAAAGVRLQPFTPGLEDVFIALVRSAQREGAHA